MESLVVLGFVLGISSSIALGFFMIFIIKHLNAEKSEPILKNMGAVASIFKPTKNKRKPIVQNDEKAFKYEEGDPRG